MTLVEYTEGWNLIGLPLIVDDSDYQIQFSESIEGTLYSFDGSYDPEETLTQGNGYWLLNGLLWNGGTFH